MKLWRELIMEPPENDPGDSKRRSWWGEIKRLLIDIDLIEVRFATLMRHQKR